MSKKQLYIQNLQNLPSIHDESLRPYLDKISDAKQELLSKVRNGQIAPLNIAHDLDDLEEIRQLANKISKSFKRVIILGVGGSSLGGKTLVALKNNSDCKVDFFESIDVDTINSKLSDIDLKNTFFIAISKSGETIETICQTLIILEKFRDLGISKPKDNFIFITQDKKNTIAKIALKINCEIYPHPNDIGGRFSYLSIVGLLPAALVGFDIKKIRHGAKETLDNFFIENIEQNSISQICALQLYLFDNGFSSNVVMPYIDSLKDFTDWYRQLWAESLGKNGFGSTPINSMGTVDQHSQLQLYLDGPKDKFFTFITNKNPKIDFKVIDLKGQKTLFGGKNLGDIVKIEQNSTIEILSRKNLPIRVLEINCLNEETLSALMMQMFLETIIIANAKNIDPFGQEAVEERKKLAKKYLEA